MKVWLPWHAGICGYLCEMSTDPKKLRLTLDWGFFWRESPHDALYSIATLPIRSV